MCTLVNGTFERCCICSGSEHKVFRYGVDMEYVRLLLPPSVLFALFFFFFPFLFQFFSILNKLEGCFPIPRLPVHLQFSADIIECAEITL